jgi:asparaginyl-tRNA synthetase
MELIFNEDVIKLWLAFLRFSSMLRLRSAMTKAVHDYFHEQDFVQVHTPVFTSNDCEGAGETFTVVPGSDALLKQMRKEKAKDTAVLVAEEGNKVGMRDEEVFFDKKVHLTVSSQLHLESAVR